MDTKNIKSERRYFDLVSHGCTSEVVSRNGTWGSVRAWTSCTVRSTVVHVWGPDGFPAGEEGHSSPGERERETTRRGRLRSLTEQRTRSRPPPEEGSSRLSTFPSAQVPQDGAGYYWIRHVSPSVYGITPGSRQSSAWTVQETPTP